MRARAIFALAVLLAATPAAAESLIYRIDSATAVINGKRMIVTAKGAVKSGGWDRPRLVLRKKEREPGDVEIAFVANPPEDSAVVVHSLMPVSVKLTTRLPKSGVAAVRVIGETNSVTAQIIPATDRERTARQ